MLLFWLTEANYTSKRQSSLYLWSKTYPCHKKLMLLHLQKKLNDALSGPVEALLDGAGDDTWPAIRKLLRRETESAVSGFSVALSSFDMDEQTTDKMLASLEDYARGVVELKTKEEAARVLIRMKDRYCVLVTHYEIKFSGNRLIELFQPLN